jgi:hypothetical protein
MRYWFFLIRVWFVVFQENWLRWPRRGGTLVLDFNEMTVRVEPE